MFNDFPDLGLQNSLFIANHFSQPYFLLWFVRQISHSAIQKEIQEVKPDLGVITVLMSIYVSLATHHTQKLVVLLCKVRPFNYPNNIYHLGRNLIPKINAKYGPVHLILLVRLNCICSNIEVNEQADVS